MNVPPPPTFTPAPPKAGPPLTPAADAPTAQPQPADPAGPPAVPEITPAQAPETPQNPPTAETRIGPNGGNGPIPSPTPPTEQASHTPSPAEAPKPDHRALLGKANSARTLKREQRLEDVMAVVRKKAEATNTDIARALRVSQSTASVLLATLVAQGRLTRIGKARATRYRISKGRM